MHFYDMLNDICSNTKAWTKYFYYWAIDETFPILFRAVWNLSGLYRIVLDLKKHWLGCRMRQPCDPSLALSKELQNPSVDPEPRQRNRESYSAAQRPSHTVSLPTAVTFSSRCHESFPPLPTWGSGRALSGSVTRIPTSPKRNKSGSPVPGPHLTRSQLLSSPRNSMELSFAGVL